MSVCFASTSVLAGVSLACVLLMGCECANFSENAQIPSDMKSLT